jgi:hypothetical protein
LYKASRDGWARSTFHALCDNKGRTITLVKLPNGRRFGGYTSINWDSTHTAVWDTYSYLFSLDSKRVIRDNVYQSKIYHSSFYGPYFGDSNFYGETSTCNLCQYGGDTASNYHAGIQGADKSGYPVTLDASGNNILTGMKPGKITPSEVEVWLINF